jgi:cytochrome c peroxidase
MRLRRSFLTGSLPWIFAGCGGDGPVTPAPLPVVIGTQIVSRSTTVGVPLSIDLADAFIDQKGQGLTYVVSYTPSVTTLSLAGGVISGTPDAAGITTATVTARDAGGATATQSFSLIVFASDLTAPVFTETAGYSDAANPAPLHYSSTFAPGGSALATSNTPPANITTDAGARLGRVLFHDRRLSANDRVSCSSCHIQQFGFGDTAQFSMGFNGGKTTRHSPGIANARYYRPGRFFWDERAATLEDQTLQPIQNAVEMGLTIPQLVEKIRLTAFYAPLFQAAFGSQEISSDRISRAIAQYVRSIVSYGSRIDSALATAAPVPDLALLTAQEKQGLTLFNGPAGCARCHITNAHVSDVAHNTGLDATITDPGVGNGAFKSPSLRNVAVRGRFMHDGRFTSLDQVVAFYDSGIQPNPGLDGRLRVGPNGPPQRLNLTQVQRDAIVAYLRTLTDAQLLKDPRFANPFPH